jgi:hypothetical protein
MHSGSHVSREQGVLDVLEQMDGTYKTDFGGTPMIPSASIPKTLDFQTKESVDGGQ